MIFFDESLASIFSFNMLQHTADFSPPETPRSQESQFQLQICEALDLTHSPPLKTTKQRSPATIKIPAVVATSMSQVKSTSCCKLASESPLAIYINLPNMAMGSPWMNRGFQWENHLFIAVFDFFVHWRVGLSHGNHWKSLQNDSWDWNDIVWIHLAGPPGVRWKKLGT